MGSLLVAFGVVALDAMMLAGRDGPGVLLWVVPLWAAAVAARRWSPLASFVAALTLACLSGGAYALLIWAAFAAGRAARTRADLARAVGAALGGIAVQVLAAPLGDAVRTATTTLVFVALPLLVGRYLEQHARLVAALRQRNDEVTERERLAERLRLARDMHDGLGHRLSLVSIQAAALEVGTLPAAERAAVERLAAAARGAVDELHALVATLRVGDALDTRSPGLAGLPALVDGFRAAGVPVTFRSRGTPRPLPGPAGRAAFRVVEEGLTNVAKHAPGQPADVTVTWEPDALLLTLTNPPPTAPATASPVGGHGLRGLADRVGAVGGLVDHRDGGDGFRLSAMIPIDEAAESPGRTLVLGAATAAALLVLLPVSVAVGIR